MVIDQAREPGWDYSICFYCGHELRAPFIERRGHDRERRDHWDALQLHEECAFRLAVVLEEDVKECREALVLQNVDGLMAKLFPRVARGRQP